MNEVLQYAETIKHEGDDGNTQDNLKEIPDYQGRYFVSDCGKVFSKDARILYKDGRIALHKGKEIKRHDNGHGYLFAALWKNNECKQEYIHRLVALAFIPNDAPNEKTQVNHIDENKRNNNVSNLEWITPIDNVRYGTGSLRMGIGHSKKIRATGSFGVRQFQGGTQASLEMGLCAGLIRRAARNNGYYAGALWEYV